MLRMDVRMLAGLRSTSLWMRPCRGRRDLEPAAASRLVLLIVEAGLLGPASCLAGA
jgi:hypothetical protein